MKFSTTGQVKGDILKYNVNYYSVVAAILDYSSTQIFLILNEPSNDYSCSLG